jgi:hypothetical protein
MLNSKNEVVMKRTYFSIAILLLGLTFASCDDELADINKNPNATENPQPAYLLSAVEYHAANLYWGDATSYNSTLLWVQHWAKIQYTEPDCYNVTNTSFTSTWNTAYSSLLTDLSTIQQSELANQNFRAVAQVLLAWTFLQLTNLYGDIPYTEYAKSVTPAYDSQEDVLRGLLAELDDAQSKLQPDGGAVEGDLIFNNDISKWKKFARSLRLRIALEIADRDVTTAGTIITSLYNDRSSLISSNGDNAQFKFATSPQWNPWASAFASRDDQRVSKTLVDKLLELNDPRLAVFAQLPQDETVSNYAGAANGLNADAANNQGFYRVSRPGSRFLADESPAVFFTYAEVLFAFAEAAARGLINADAAALYNEGVSASFQQFGIASAADYLKQSSVAYDASAWAERIGWQKWIAFYGQGPDAYTDWRRLGYPKLQPGPNSALATGEFPRRFFYPSTEQSLNGNNYHDAVAHQGADELTTRLWFDVENKNR